jgi:wyosine [tRNA(Phe)-imidazoG37] synthetase (radical SAM superfamily)
MLFGSIVYGPIRSRRLGVSLGVNLMPIAAKLCTFDCVYCECGWNQPVLHPNLPTREEVRAALESQLSAAIEPIDVITFSGNGEPTLHPDFLGIIQDTCALRDQYCPKAKVSVLSNSTQLGRTDVIEALRLCDNRILKLDSAIDATMRLIDKPVNAQLTVKQIAQWLSIFDGDFTLQTCFLRGEYQGQTIDNTTPEELTAWYKMVDYLHPKQVMIYVIDRVTPLETLEKIPAETMEKIAIPLREKGIDVIVSV